jgi:cysteine sulfinate desulfinase/cysteine desulfurase-like protein
MKVPKQELFSSLRFSVGRYTNKDDIDYAVEQLTKLIKEKNRALGGSGIIKLDM